MKKRLTAIGLLVLCIAPLKALSQWELITQIPSVTVLDVYGRHGKYCAISVNHSILISDADSIWWKQIAILPAEVVTNDDTRVELSNQGDVYVMADDVYKYDIHDGSWTNITRGLNLGKEMILDIAVGNTGQVVVKSTDMLRTYITDDDGENWREMHTSFVPFWDDNDVVQYADVGAFYYRNDYGLFKTTNEGVTWSELGKGTWTGTLGSTHSSLRILNDSLIICTDPDNNVKRYNAESDSWEVVWSDEDHSWPLEIALGSDGTIFIVHLGGFHSPSFRLLWSKDLGSTWASLQLKHENGTNQALPWIECLGGDSTHMTLFEPWGGEIYQYDLRDTTKYGLRSAPIARSDSYEIQSNNIVVSLIGWSHSHHYSMKEGWHWVRYTGEFSIYGINNIFLRDGTHYWREVRTNHGVFGSIGRQRLYTTGGLERLPCMASQFVVNSKNEIIGADPGGLVFNGGTVCVPYNIIDHFPGVLISINGHDELFVTSNTGRFRMYDANEHRVHDGALPAVSDTIISIQNDLHGNLVLLSGPHVFVSHDYGNDWQESLLDNGGAAMQKVVVDYRNTFYALDSLGQTFMSTNAGDTWTPLTLDLEGLVCTVSNMAVDSDYVYLSTTGCGAFRMALPIVDAVEHVPAPKTMHQGMNLYAGAHTWTTFEIPFRMDENAVLEIYDLQGRRMYQVAYSADESRSQLQIRTGSLNTGTYVYKLVSAGQTLTGKIMVMR